MCYIQGCDIPTCKDAQAVVSFLILFSHIRVYLHQYTLCYQAGGTAHLGAESGLPKASTGIPCKASIIEAAKSILRSKH